MTGEVLAKSLANPRGTGNMAGRGNGRRQRRARADVPGRTGHSGGRQRRGAARRDRAHPGRGGFCRHPGRRGSGRGAGGGAAGLCSRRYRARSARGARRPGAAAPAAAQGAVRRRLRAHAALGRPGRRRVPAVAVAPLGIARLRLRIAAARRCGGGRSGAALPHRIARRLTRAGILPASANPTRTRRNLGRGAWRSLVAHLLWEQDVGGSNPLAPTIRGGRMARARIFRPAKTAMQSGRAQTRQWVLEYEPATPREPEPLMGWTSARDTLNQVRLRFATLDEAKSFAEKEGLDYTVIAPHERSLKPKSYADNFRYDRVRV